MDRLLQLRRRASAENMLMASHLHCEGRAVIRAGGGARGTASLLLRGEIKAMKKPLNDQELLSEVEKIICNVFRVSESKVRPDTTLVGDLGAESIDFLDLGCDLEKIVDAEIDFRKLFQEKRARAEDGSAALDVTVQELVEYLKVQIDLQTVSSATVQ